MRILLVEDELRLIEALKFSLTKAGFIVDYSTNGEDGLDLALSDIYDVIILDRMLPRMDGIQILTNIRKEKINTPVLFLTAKDTIDDKVTGLDAGADDYLVKPFSTKELISRIKALYRRKEKDFMDSIIQLGNLSFNSENCEITCENNSLSLTFKETQILELLAVNKGRAITKEMIIERIWGFDSEIESNNLEAYISYLRKKISKLNTTVRIETIRNVGYMIKEE